MPDKEMCFINLQNWYVNAQRSGIWNSDLAYEYSVLFAYHQMETRKRQGAPECKYWLTEPYMSVDASLWAKRQDIQATIEPIMIAFVRYHPEFLRFDSRELKTKITASGEYATFLELYNKLKIENGLEN